MAERNTLVTVADGDQLNEGYYNGLYNELLAGTGHLGEVRMFALSITGAVSKATLQSYGWAICDGTSSSDQGISDATITTTPNLEHKFIRGSDDETSGGTGGTATHTHSVEGNSGGSIYGSGGSSFHWATITSGETANLPPYYELAYFIRVKII
jgi:hypothetical protein